MRSEAHNCDCLAFMRLLPDNAFALAIADPPYGLPASSSRTWSDNSALKDRAFSRGKIGETWDKAPSREFFAELTRVSENQIIWGGNYFDLPPTRCVVCWDKCQPWENFSQWEMAWTSFEKPAPLFRFDNRTTGKIHPTQKPVALYSWLLRRFWTGGVVFDPMMGSQSSRIAAHFAGADFVGCELDPEYFAKGNARFDAATRQLLLPL